MNTVYPNRKFKFDDCKQTRPFNLIKTDKKTNGCYGVVHGDDNKRTWYKRDTDFIYSSELNIFEVIKGACCFFADLENHNGKSKEELYNLLESFKKDFPDFFRKYWKITNDLWFYIFPTFSTADYPSAHIFVSIECGKKIIATANPFLQKYFWRSFIQVYPKYAEFLDLNIYTRERQFRLIYSPSKKKESTGSYHIPCSTIYEMLTCNQGLLIEERAPLVHFKANYADAEYENLMFLTDVKCMRKKQFLTVFEKEHMERILRNAKININRYVDWFSAIKRIYTYFKLSGGDALKEILDFCARCGWGDKNHVRENTLMFEGFEKSNLLDPHTLVDNEAFFLTNIKTCADDYVTYNVDGPRIQIIRASTGMGKTKNFCETFTKRVLALVPRRSLADDYGNLQKNYGFVDYRALDVKKNGLPNKLVCCINSLHKIKDLLEHFDVVLFDEITSICDMFDFVLENNTYRNVETIRVCLKIILDTKKVFLVSANVSFETHTFLELFDQKDYEQINYTKQNYVGREVYVVDKKEVFLEKIRQLSADKKKLIIPTNSKVAANNIEQVLSGKTLKIVASKENKINVAEWDEYDNVIYTPCIESGVSHETEHFDHIVGYFVKNSSNYSAIHQQLFRARKPKCKEMYLYVDHNNYLKSKDSFGETEMSEIIQINQMNVQEKLAATDFELKNEKLYGPLNRMVFEAHKKERYSNSELRNLIISDLKKVGYVKCEFVEVFETKKITYEYHNNVVLKEENNYVDTHTKKIAMGITAENFSVKSTENIITVIDNLYNGFTLNKKYLSNEQIFLLKFKAAFNGTMESIDKFVQNNFKVSEALIVRKERRKTAEHFIKARPCDKFKMINSRIGLCGYKISKGDNCIVLDEVEDLKKIKERTKLPDETV